MTNREAPAADEIRASAAEQSALAPLLNLSPSSRDADTPLPRRAATRHGSPPLRFRPDAAHRVEPPWAFAVACDLPATTRGPSATRSSSIAAPTTRSSSPRSGRRSERRVSAASRLVRGSASVCALRHSSEPRPRNPNHQSATRPSHPMTIAATRRTLSGVIDASLSGHLEQEMSAELRRGAFVLKQHNSLIQDYLWPEGAAGRGLNCPPETVGCMGGRRSPPALSLLVQAACRARRSQDARLVREAVEPRDGSSRVSSRRSPPLPCPRG
jgi:hypothetical protein